MRTVKADYQTIHNIYQYKSQYIAFYRASASVSSFFFFFTFCCFFCSFTCLSEFPAIQSSGQQSTDYRKARLSRFLSSEWVACGLPHECVHWAEVAIDCPLRHILNTLGKPFWRPLLLVDQQPRDASLKVMAMQALVCNVELHSKNIRGPNMLSWGTPLLKHQRT